ncbi:MAG TPA: phosphoglucosamine mutase [Alphaproteobacteria bacterium]|nr:phosphoglucosamine mutase [Alphaproteobacteria bacterium]
MARKLFGTDGIRGTANSEPMTAEIALKVAIAAGRHFRRGEHRHRVVIGKDTRLSGYTMEPALVAGFASMGMDVFTFGPIPTPAVAMLTRSMRADLGVMISASHNLYQDNGIKLFGPDGYKLSDEIEGDIERHVAEGVSDDLVPSAKLGRVKRLDDAAGRYIEFVKATFPKDRTLEGLKIVVDCANGAAYRVAPTVLWELGAEVIPMAVEPNGFNINEECGATKPQRLRERVIAEHADLGIALDGDADRVVLVDEKADVVDGDQLMALIAADWKRRGRLAGDGLVATVMSNLGLERYLDGLGIALARTKVGDRYVVEHMRDHGFNVGGEQSGHIVLSDYATTGDGLIAALQVLAVLTETRRKPASVSTRIFEPVPQILRNAAINGSAPLEAEPVKTAIAEGETRLGKGGRLLIRPSGTEPLIRVMAEGDDAKLIGEVVETIVKAIEGTAG